MTLEFKTLRAARRWFFYGLFDALAADGVESIELDELPPGDGDPSWTMRWTGVTVALEEWSSGQSWTNHSSLDQLDQLVVDLLRGTRLGMPDALIEGALEFGLEVRGHRLSMGLPQRSAALRLLELEPRQRALFERISKIMLGTS